MGMISFVGASHLFGEVTADNCNIPQTELFKYRTATGTIFLPVFYAELSLVIIVSLWDGQLLL